MSATLLGTLARTTEPQTVLRRFLAADAVVTGANGLAYAAFSAPSAGSSGSARGWSWGSASCSPRTRPESACSPPGAGRPPSV